MYIMFIYVNDSVWNSMGIREDSLEDLYYLAAIETKKIFQEYGPHAEINVKVSMYL